MRASPEQRQERFERASAAALSCFWLRGAAGGGRFMLVGELDLVTADRARVAIRRAQDETSALVCDLGDVWFVDFSGLRVLLDAADRARRTGARLTIASCPPLVPRMLALLRLEDRLEIRAAPRGID
jgi:anti-sigma B factor antagonist